MFCTVCCAMFCEMCFLFEKQSWPIIVLRICMMYCALFTMFCKISLARPLRVIVFFGVETNRSCCPLQSRRQTWRRVWPPAWPAVWPAVWPVGWPVGWPVVWSVVWSVVWLSPTSVSSACWTAEVRPPTLPTRHLVATARYRWSTPTRWWPRARSPSATRRPAPSMCRRSYYRCVNICEDCLEFPSIKLLANSSSP